MARNKKCFVHGEVRFVTTRILEGLPLVPHAYMTHVLKSILARALEHYPVVLGDLMVMGNHIHLLVQIINPLDMDLFMRYFKTESARAINVFLGKENGPVWCEGYDAPVVLDMDAYRKRLVYLYTNPQQASLVDTIEEYPNFSTWNIFCRSGYEKQKTSRFFRASIPQVKSKKVSSTMIEFVTKKLLRNSCGENKLPFSPKKIFIHFADSGDSWKDFQKSIIEEVRIKEKELCKARSKEQKSVLGRYRIFLQSIFTKHTPKKFAKRMLCLGSSRKTRKYYINIYKSLCEEYREIALEWKRGIFTRNFPPGFFPPGGVRPRVSMWPVAFGY